MKDKYPMQPINGGRFESNPIVDWLCTTVSNMNDIAHYCAENDVPYKYQEQLAQLVGYSVGGYGSLSYVSDESYERAESIMNTNNLATQNPEEKEALDLIDTTPHQYEMSKFSGNGDCKLVDGDIVYDSDGNEIKIINANMIYGLDSTGTFDYWDCADLQKTKPESPDKKQKREWIEYFASEIKNVGTVTYKEILGRMYDSLK